MRSAITIIYNGMNHLTHKGFSEFMIKSFDHWIIVEGMALNGGSTKWIKKPLGHGSSVDGTQEFILDLQARYPDKVHCHIQGKPHDSKDDQFNHGIRILKSLTDECYLWQVDADEHWQIDDLILAERRLERSICNVASFQFNHFVGDDVVAVGEWGSGRVNRLWKWKGRLFQSHEPARMQGQSMPLELPQKFDHYSMVFADDVRFKSKVYPGNEQVYHNWIRMNDWEYPCHVSRLFGKNNKIGRSETYLYKYSLLCANAQNQKVAKEADN